MLWRFVDTAAVLRQKTNNVHPSSKRCALVDYTNCAVVVSRQVDISWFDIFGGCGGAKNSNISCLDSFVCRKTCLTRDAYFPLTTSNTYRCERRYIYSAARGGPPMYLRINVSIIHE